MNNYRAMANSRSNILESIIFRNSHTVDSEDRDLHQFGYKQPYSSYMWTSVLKNTVQYYTIYGNHVIACFIDINKAFGKVDYWLLFCKLY